MTSLHDDVGSALAGLLDGWSDSEMLPLLASLSPTDEDAAQPAEGSTNATNATQARPLLPDRPAVEPEAASAVRNESNDKGRAKTKRSGDSNVTRKREREERRRLELEAYSLEKQLASTLRRRQALESGVGRGKSSSSVEMWAQVARNQLAAKQKAELRNAALRELLGEQLRLARSMERMASRRFSSQAVCRALGVADFGPRKRLHSSTSPSDDRLTFQRLFQSVDRSFRELDSVFHRGCEERSLAADESSQFTYSATIPFAMTAAMAAAWAFLSRDQHSVAGGEYRVVERTASTIACESVAVLGASDGSDADRRDGGLHAIRLRCALKKAEERDRIVLVWQSVTARESLSPSARGGGTGAPSLEQSGWLVLSNAPVASTDAVATKIQMCVRYPMRQQSAHSGPDRGSHGVDTAEDRAVAPRDNGYTLDPLSELIFRDAGRSVGAWYQYVENILMEQQRVAV